MSRERPLTTGEKWALWWAQHNPRKKSRFGDAYTEIKPAKPMDFNFEGAPHYYKEKAVLVVGFIFWTIMYFVTEACIRQTYVMDLILLTQLGMAANILAGLGAVALIYMFVDAHKGTFQNYWKIIEVTLRFLDGRPPYKAELRVKHGPQLWPLTEDNVKIINFMELEVVEDYAEMYEDYKDSLKKKAEKKNIAMRAADALDELIEVFHS